MPEPTSYAKAMFGPIWGLCMMGALGSCRAVKLPFDAQYYEYVDSQVNTVSQLLENIQLGTGISSDIIQAGITDAPWAPQNRRISNYYDQFVMNAEMGIWSGKREWVEFDFNNSESIFRAVQQRVSLQLRCFFTAFLAARFSFLKSATENGVDAGFLEECETVLQFASKLAGLANPCEDVVCLCSVFVDWRKSELAGIMDSPDANELFRKWLAGRIVEIEAKCRLEKIES